MNFSPDYGKTPLTYDEVSALTPLFRRAQREPDKQSIYQIEQSIENAVGEKLVLAVASGKLGLFDLLSDYFLRRLHSDLYGDKRRSGSRGSRSLRRLATGTEVSRVGENLGKRLGTVYPVPRVWFGYQEGDIHHELDRVFELPVA